MEQKQIKFRIWNGNQMEYNVIAGKFGAFYVNPENDGINPDDTACLTTFNTKYWENTPVMQFTQARDINMVDIYEGDIISIVAPKHDDKYQVLWIDGWRLKNLSRDLLPGDMHRSFTDSNREYYKILGNVFENHELTV